MKMARLLGTIAAMEWIPKIALANIARWLERICFGGGMACRDMRMFGLQRGTACWAAAVQTLKGYGVAETKIVDIFVVKFVPYPFCEAVLDWDEYVEHLSESTYEDDTYECIVSSFDGEIFVATVAGDDNEDFADWAVWHIARTGGRGTATTYTETMIRDEYAHEES